MSKTIDYYDDNAKTYFDSTVDADMSEHYSIFLKYLPGNAYILDLGCGSGRDSKFFLDKGYKVKAVDGSRKMCELASKYLGQTVENIRFEDLAFEKEFDAVWASASLLHENKEKIEEVVEKIRRSLKDGGIFYVSFKYGDCDRIQKERYFNDMNEEKLSKLLKDFSIKEIWFSDDVRPGRNDRWINSIAKKSIIREQNIDKDG